MSENQTKKKNSFLTSVHPCLWNWLLTPDTRWSEHGTFGTDMLMSLDDAKALAKEVTEEVGTQAAKVRHDTPAAKDWKLAWPMKEYEGDDESLKGMKVVSFKQKVVPGYNFAVDVFDAKKHQITPGSLRIGNMTRLRIRFYVRVVADNLNKVVRILFHPRAAQIIDLVKWEADYGFDEQEGFVANESKSATSISDLRPKQVVSDDPFGEPESQDDKFNADDIPF